MHKSCGGPEQKLGTSHHVVRWPGFDLVVSGDAVCAKPIVRSQFVRGFYSPIYTLGLDKINLFTAKFYTLSTALIIKVVSFKNNLLLKGCV